MKIGLLLPKLLFYFLRYRVVALSGYKGSDQETVLSQQVFHRCIAERLNFSEAVYESVTVYAICGPQHGAHCIVLYCI